MTTLYSFPPGFGHCLVEDSPSATEKEMREQGCILIAYFSGLQDIEYGPWQGEEKREELKIRGSAFDVCTTTVYLNFMVELLPHTLRRKVHEDVMKI
ncbi:hypothetical protein M8J77_006800 [Diaphorina citri]|nr:hypothetical protein M8J77_006800 [Diaphorina citri]